MILLKSRTQQLTALCLIGRAGNAHVGYAAQKRNVIGPRMGGAVSTDQTGSVQRKHHRQVLQCHVVNQLVIATLQKRRVNCHHRLEPFAGHAGCKRHGVLLGNAHVVVSLGKTPVKLHHARAFAHGGCDAHQPGVMLSHVTQPLAKHLGEGLLGRHGGLLQPHGRVELARSVVSHRIRLGQLVTLAFFGHHMQELRARAVVHQLADVFHRRDERLQVVSINRADVVEAEVFEQGGGHHHAFGMRFQALGQFKQGRGDAKHLLANLLG